MGFLLLSKGCIPGPHDFAFVSGLASHSGCLGPREFTLVSHTCLPLWVPWARMSCLHLSPTLGVLGRMSLHLSPTLGVLGHTCLPHLSPTLGVLGRT